MTSLLQTDVALAASAKVSADKWLVEDDAALLRELMPRTRLQVRRRAVRYKRRLNSHHASTALAGSIIRPHKSQKRFRKA